MTYKHIISTSSISRDYGYIAGRNSSINGAVTEKYDISNFVMELKP